MRFAAGTPVDVDGRRGRVVDHSASESHLVVVRYDRGGIFKVGMHRVRVLEGTSALPLASAGAEDPPVGTDSASRERAVTAAADAAAAPPGCTCGGSGVCLHCFFAAADTVEQRMMAAALEATEQALAREVTS